MKKVRGFSLIELLCVMAIMAILIAAATPLVNSVLSALAVSSGANQVFASLNLARQDAITRNRSVAVYFFQYPTDALPAAYRGMQAWELGLSPSSTPDNPVLITTTQVTRYSALEGRTILATGLTTTAAILSPADNTTGIPGSVPTPPTPAAMGSTSLVGNYMAIIFHPDGTTSLPLTATDAGGSGGAGSSNATYYWSLTICDFAKYNKNPGVLPADSATIQMDAMSGTCQILHP